MSWIVINRDANKNVRTWTYSLERVGMRECKTYRWFSAQLIHLHGCYEASWVPSWWGYWWEQIEVILMLLGKKNATPMNLNFPEQDNEHFILSFSMSSFDCWVPNQRWDERWEIRSAFALRTWFLTSLSIDYMVDRSTKEATSKGLQISAQHVLTSDNDHWATTDDRNKKGRVSISAKKNLASDISVYPSGLSTALSSVDQSCRPQSQSLICPGHLAEFYHLFQCSFSACPQSRCPWLLSQSMLLRLWTSSP